MVQKYSDLISSFVVVVISILMYVFSLDIKKLTITNIGADSAPKMLAILLFICGAFLFIKSIVELKHREMIAIEISKYKKPLLSIGCLFIYILVLNTVGFLIATVLYLLSQFILFSYEKKSYLLYSILSVVITLIIYYLFNNVLYVFLPSGFLG